MSWKGGTLAGGASSFPATGQTRPGLTGLFRSASTTITPKNTTVDANGKVDLTLQLDVLLGAGANECRLTGTTRSSSAGTGEAQRAGDWKNYNPATGAFAVASTTSPAPTTTGSCLLTSAGYNVSKGQAGT